MTGAPADDGGGGAENMSERETMQVALALSRSMFEARHLSTKGDDAATPLDTAPEERAQERQ